MERNQKTSMHIFRAALVAVFVLSLLALWRVWQVAHMIGVVLFSSKWAVTLAGIGGFALLMGSIFALTWNAKICQWANRFFDEKIPDTRMVKAISILLFVLMVIFYSWLFLLSPWKGIFILLENNYFQWWLFLIFGMIAAIF